MTHKIQTDEAMVYLFLMHLVFSFLTLNIKEQTTGEKDDILWLPLLLIDKTINGENANQKFCT